MEIGNETRGPTMITFGLLGPQLCLVIWKTVAMLGVQAHHSAGGFASLDESHSKPLNYIWTVNSAREHRVKSFGRGSLSQRSLCSACVLFQPPKKASSKHPSMLPSFYSALRQQRGSWHKPGRPALKELTWKQSNGVNSRPRWQSAV